MRDRFATHKLQLSCIFISFHFIFIARFDLIYLAIIDGNEDIG